jgi:thioredoxin 1
MSLFKRNKDKQEDAPVAEKTMDQVEPLHVTGEEFQTLVLGSDIPAVVDFWAEWCGPCHAIAPAVAQLANEYEGRALIAKVNADEYPEILMNYGIMGIPTLLYFKGGEVVDRVVGVNSYSNLKNKLEKVLA